MMMTTTMCRRVCETRSATTRVRRATRAPHPCVTDASPTRHDGASRVDEYRVETSRAMNRRSSRLHRRAIESIDAS
jgi:hypothetical protein